MILNRIREINLKNKIENELKNIRTNSNTKVESVLILLDESVNASVLELIIKELKFDEQNIKKIIFSDVLNNASQNFEINISKKQFNWLGRIKNERVVELVNFQFDMLINLTKGNLYLDYLTVLSNSQFKVGLANSDNRFYDFMISTDLESGTIFSIELKKYLKILNKI